MYSRSDFGLIANFKNGNFRINAGMSFEGGIQECFTFLCAEASAKACVNIAGGFSDAKGWNFSASGEAVGNEVYQLHTNKKNQGRFHNAQQEKCKYLFRAIV